MSHIHKFESDKIKKNIKNYIVSIDSNVEDENLNYLLKTFKNLWCKEDLYWKSSEEGFTDGIGYTMITGESSGGQYWEMSANV